MSDVQVRHEVDRRRFVADIEGKEAEITYSRPDDTTLDLQHTFTPPEARGKGIASALVRAALDYARHEGLQVIPTCPYVGSWLDKHPDYADLRK